MTTALAPFEERARTALAKFGGKQYGTADEVTNALSELAEYFPVFAPGGTTSCAQVAAGHKISVTSAIPRMCDEKGNGGDVFIDKSSDTLCFRATFLKVLAAGIGLDWLPQFTRVTFPANGHPWCVSVTVAAQYRDYSGEMRTVSATKTLDLRDEAKPKATGKQLDRQRNDISQLAETMAKSRCVADACVDRTISPGDVGKPVIMSKLYRVDPIDPKVAHDALYGGSKKGAGDGIDSAKPAAAEVMDQRTGEVTQAPAEGATTQAATDALMPTPEELELAKVVSKAFEDEKPLSDPSLTDDHLFAYSKAATARLKAKGATWNEAGREGAKRRIAAVDAELKNRMGAL